MPPPSMKGSKRKPGRKSSKVRQIAVLSAC
jgi:hypothetical protein